MSTSREVQRQVSRRHNPVATLLLAALLLTGGCRNASDGEASTSEAVPATLPTPETGKRPLEYDAARASESAPPLDAREDRGPNVHLVGGPEMLSPNEQSAALRLARAAVEEFVRHGRHLDPAELGIEPTGALGEQLGLFVTLKRDGRLRGCIGNIWPRARLLDGILGRAVDAAVHDGRFPPVSEGELDSLHVEVSVLSTPAPVDGPPDIEIGRHGIVISKFGRSAVFLPQVAPEQGWTLEQTLSHLSQKAGLPPDAWHSGMTFEVFEAQVFEETHH